ncbi:cytochrome aa3 quinol oxidase subunit III [Bacillus megaterium]|nr:cytochrome aa3 quinol oxidase subunit III [Priestia megaterium]
MAGHLDKSLPLEYQEEQSRLNILGFWIFLGAEIALFSTLFVTYLTYHTRTAGGPTAEELFVAKDFMIETLLLLFSSFTMGIAIFKMRNNDLKGLLVWFVITLVLGGGFLFYEIREFYMYAVPEGATMQTSAFLSGFFTLLGTHGLHVTVGVFWSISIIIHLLRRGLTPLTAHKVFIIGLYWHFLDVVWIFIFTLVYLNGLVG